MDTHEDQVDYIDGGIEVPVDSPFSYVGLILNKIAVKSYVIVDF